MGLFGFNWMQCLSNIKLLSNTFSENGKLFEESVLIQLKNV